MDQLRLAGIIGSDGKVLQRFVYGTKPHVPDYFVMNGDIYRIITDHLGSVRLVVRVKDGLIVQEMVHDEFGKTLSSTGAGFQPFGFAGGLYDYNTGFVQFGARWYDPQVGRWISKDPIVFGGGDSNLYGYVGNNPINNIDPTGNTIINLTGDNRISANVDPNLSALYKKIDNNRNIAVIIKYGKAGGNFASTWGNSKRITMVIDPTKNTTNAVLFNTIAHELMHVTDIISGNLDTALARQNYDLAEGPAEDFANNLFDRDSNNKCP